MDWNKIKSDGYKEVAGTKHDLSHLKDAKHHFTIEASGRHPEISFSILVQYSSHCVSWGPKHGQEIDFTAFGEERCIIDDKGIHRCFCETRHELSFNLPSIFATLTERLCLFTGHENWLTIEILDPSGKRLEYEVFFSLTKQSSRMLRIYVESAYVRDPNDPGNRPVHLKRRDKVRAKVLLAKKLRGEPIRRPNSRKGRR
jgi:hypothetical protein